MAVAVRRAGSAGKSATTFSNEPALKPFKAKTIYFYARGITEKTH